MITELVLLLPLILPLILLFLCDYLKFRTAFIIIFITVLILYWLPKFLIKPLILISILTHNPKLTYTPDLIEKYVSLTFDDVPYGYHTDIINKLDQYHQKATLFVISDYVTTQHENFLINAVINGHQLGNHGKTNSMHALLSYNDLSYEILHCDNLIKSIYNKANISLSNKMLYRPGCGIVTPTILEVSRQLNYTVTLGTVYPNDPIFIISWWNYWYLRLHIEHGDIIILHDRMWTSTMLDMLLPWLKYNSIKSVTIDTLISY